MRSQTVVVIRRSARRVRVPVTRRSRLARAAHLALALLFLAQQSAWAATITVSGGCTLPDAITAANTDSPTGGCSAGSGADSVALTGDVTLATVNNTTNGPNGLPSVTSDVTIEGNGHTVARSGAGGTPQFRLFHVAQSGTLTLDEVTISGGNVSSPPYAGGGVANYRGNLTVYETTLANNSANAGAGLSNTGTATITNSTLSANSATGSGGAILTSSNVVAYPALTTLTNATLSGNLAFAMGGGVFNTGSQATTNVFYSTLSGNNAVGGGGGIANGLGSVGVYLSIVAGSALGGNCSGSITDFGANFSDDGTCGGGFATITPLVDYTLLADNGGPTKTHALLPGSVAIDVVVGCGSVQDQRGLCRPEGGACDAGAFEFKPTPVPPGPISVGPGGPTPACTLVDAITAANTDADVGSCLGAPFGASSCGDPTDLANTIELTGDRTLTVVDNSTDGPNGLPSVTSDVTLDGNGHTVARSSAGGTPAFRLFHVASNGTLALNEVTITNGESADGGGIFNRGTTELTDSTVSGNSAFLNGGGLLSFGTATLTGTTVSGNSADYGGGILSYGTATLTDTTVSGNSAETGGGLFNTNTGAATLTNTTVSGNSAANYGGGIYSLGGTATLTNVTVSGNSADYGGGVYTSGTAALINTTVSGNSASGPNALGGGIRNLGLTTLTNSLVGHSTGSNCFGGITNGGNSQADDATCGAIPSTLTGLDPTLADNGGPTQTHALLAGSSAIDAAGSCGLATDQRGAPRPASPCDSGAFEVQPPSCGSGFVDHGEQCDDGNTSDGDCCSATCQFQPALGVGGMPNCCSAGVCQTGVGCGAVCFTPGAVCKQDAGPGTACTCEIP